MSNDIPDRFTILEETLGEWDWATVERCIVCNLAIKKEEPIGRCTQCGHPGHLDHFQEWIKIKGVCPFCKRKIIDKDLRRE
jgi:rubrerythrin